MCYWDKLDQMKNKIKVFVYLLEMDIRSLLFHIICEQKMVQLAFENMVTDVGNSPFLRQC